MATGHTVAVANDDEVISNGVINPTESESNNALNTRIWYSNAARDASDGSSTSATSRNQIWTPSYHGPRSGRNNPSTLWIFRDIKGQNRQWNCFFCFHVCSGTIGIGLWHALMHLLAFSMIAVVMVHPELRKFVRKDIYAGEHLEIYPEGMQDVQAVNCSKTPCLLAAKGNGRFSHVSEDLPIVFGDLILTQRFNIEDVNMALFVTSLTFIITLILIYGAYRGQPTYLMPFFFFQVFEFCISSMTIIGSLAYLPNIRQMIHHFPYLPLRQVLMRMNKKCLTFFVMFMFLTSFMVKAYCINVIWRCYKYILQMGCSPWSGHSRMGHTGPVDQESQTLVMGPDLPDYDTAITDPQFRKKVSLFPEPPPSYDIAMAAYQQQEAILSQIQGESSQEVPENILLLEPPPNQQQDSDHQSTSAEISPRVTAETSTNAGR